ncbi:MAG: TIGR03032 family protein [Roseicyclus sp.]|nr:TIGR03032 family protein [Roseicyclus sp.]
MTEKKTAAEPAKPKGTANGARSTEAGTHAGTGQPDAGPATVSYSMSPGLVPRMAKGAFSIAFSSYQSGLLYMLGVKPGGGAHLHQSAQPKPMGLSFNRNGQLTMTGGFHVIRFENVLAPHERVNGLFDACFVPRRTHFTGALDAHDIGLDAEGEPVFVNTRFNCIANTDARHSFRPVWRPPFISALVNEDRCHLNGLAMDGDTPAYATAVSRSDTIDGWRDRRADGGVVIDIRRNEIVCEGLSMPHSPRLHNGELWVLNSGTGELGVVAGLEKGKGRFEPRAFCPGFLRGLSFHGGFAFVGLSKPRYKRFEGLELDDRLKKADSEPWCGVQVIDLKTGSCVDWFRIDGHVGELYDVEVLPGMTCPMSLSLTSPELADLVTYEGMTPKPAA